MASGMSGTLMPTWFIITTPLLAFCATTACTVRPTASPATNNITPRIAPLLWDALLAHRQLLHPEIANLADIQRGFSAAVDGADAPELLEELPGAAEPADHRPVETHLVNLAGRVEIGRGVRVRHEHHLVGTRRDADRLGVADVGDLALIRA